ncbi:MAG: glycine oxidase ThiO [Planctomycetota bacterium]
MSRKIAIIGGGVIGLSTAWELACRGHRVLLFEKSKVGRKASWAGAGILAPANSSTATQPLDKLLGLGSDLHESWSEKLLQQSGIDNGFWKCGGLYVARTAGEHATLMGQTQYWNEYDIEFEVVDKSDLDIERGVCLDAAKTVIHVPGEAQICNPDHLSALELACRRNEVKVLEQVKELNIAFANGGLINLRCDKGNYEFDQICLCAGAWTMGILQSLGVRIPQIPVRGQMLLFESQVKLSKIINEGSRYIVPRQDGHVLVGSTTEEVGFDEGTTEEKTEELLDLASAWVPELSRETLRKNWAGLRPATHDGFPYMGELQELSGVFISTGHFKSGLQMSPAAAVMVADLMDEKETLLDPAAFHPSRLNVKENLTMSNHI